MAELVASPEIHVWSASLAVGHDIQRERELLSPDEIVRAERLRVDAARSQFIFARGLLRRVLAGYLDRPPRAISFTATPAGKPLLTGRETPLSFNLSHSGETVLIAVACGDDVGIDVELVRPELPHMAIAERFFSLREQVMLGALPLSSRQEAFYRCWTRKEAYVKGRGTGFTLPCNRFSVTVNPEEPAALLQDGNLPQEEPLWQLADVDAPPGYIAAIAVRGPLPRLVYRQG